MMTWQEQYLAVKQRLEAMQAAESERDDWKARCEKAEKDANENWDGWQESQKGHGECLRLSVRLAEQIARLRESLEWAVAKLNWHGEVGSDVSTARAILKETQP